MTNHPNRGQLDLHAISARVKDAAMADIRRILSDYRDSPLRPSLAAVTDVWAETNADVVNAIPEARTQARAFWDSLQSERGAWSSYLPWPRDAEPLSTAERDADRLDRALAAYVLASNCGLGDKSAHLAALSMTDYVRSGEAQMMRRIFVRHIQRREPDTTWSRVAHRFTGDAGGYLPLPLVHRKDVHGCAD